MRNFAKLLGIAVIAAVIRFSMTACGEEEDIVRFDKALYGTWELDSGYFYQFALEFITSTEKDALVFHYESTHFDERLTAKNGSTYTLYNSGYKDLVFTAVIGSDGKLTISGFTDDVSGWSSEFTQFNGTYTKKAD